MKKIFPLLLILACLGGCKTFNGSMVKVTKAPIEPKMFALEKKFEDVANSVVIVAGNELRLFTQEVEENLTDPFTDKFGTIVLRRSVIKLKTGFAYGIVSGLFLMVPNLFGFPMGRLKYEVEFEIRVMDSNNKMLGKYSAVGKSIVPLALYYGYGITAGNKLETDAFNDAFSKIRPQIQADAERLNEKLIEAGKMK
jgi:hypothetical protein